MNESRLFRIATIWDKKFREDLDPTNSVPIFLKMLDKE